MNQSGSYSVSKSTAENQLLLTESSKTPVAAKSLRQNSEFHGTEKTSFLDSSEPVRLNPSWEEDANLSNDELNFKAIVMDALSKVLACAQYVFCPCFLRRGSDGSLWQPFVHDCFPCCEKSCVPVPEDDNTTMDQATLELNPPRDRLKIVYLILMLHGIGTLTPWNMFITAKSYFVDYKLSENYTGQDPVYGTYFVSYVGFASQVPNLLFNWLNIFMQFGGNLTTRVVWSIFVEVVIFVLTVVLAMSDTSSNPGAFFWTTMATVIVLNIANGIYQNTVYGMGARLPPNYTGAIILGSNISGTFTAIINLIATAISPSHRTAAIYYFITALFVLLACFDTYFALPLNRFYRYNELMTKKQSTQVGAGAKARIPYGHILWSAKGQLLNVFVTFFVTLSIFPSMHSDIHKSSADFVVPDKYYVGVMCFLVFNFFAMFGSFLTSWLKWPGPKYLWILVWLRVLLIPYFVFCNYRPVNIERTLPILIDNDWAFLAGGIVLGLTSGYCSSLAMMYVPGTVKPAHAATAGMFAGAVLITGIVMGILFSLVFPWFISSNLLW